MKQLKHSTATNSKHSHVGHACMLGTAQSVEHLQESSSTFCKESNSFQEQPSVKHGSQHCQASHYETQTTVTPIPEGGSSALTALVHNNNNNDRSSEPSGGVDVIDSTARQMAEELGSQVRRLGGALRKVVQAHREQHQQQLSLVGKQQRDRQIGASCESPSSLACCGDTGEQCGEATVEAAASSPLPAPRGARQRESSMSSMARRVAAVQTDASGPVTSDRSQSPGIPPPAECIDDLYDELQRLDQSRLAQEWWQSQHQHSLHQPQQSQHDQQHQHELQKHFKQLQHVQQMQHMQHLRQLQQCEQREIEHHQHLYEMQEQSQLLQPQPGHTCCSCRGRLSASSRASPRPRRQRSRNRERNCCCSCHRGSKKGDLQQRNYMN